MSFSYIVLGAGRQGIAAAYDLAKFGGAARVTVADVDEALAKESAEKVNHLLGRGAAEAMVLDVRDEGAVRRALPDYDVALSTVPYFFNLGLTRIAIEIGVSFCDLGGNTDIVLEQHALDAQARQAGVRVIPDCGMGPGMGNTLAVYAMSLLDRAEHVYICDGGLPQHPPELEMVEVPPLGELECFFIAGGASTAPWTFAGKLQTYELKVLRYPGNFAQLKAFSDLGLFEVAPVEVDGEEVVPRHVFHALFEPQVRAETIKDVCIVRVRAVGEKDRAPAEATVEIIDYFDEATGFSAMQRTTGWHLSIVAEMMARCETPVGSLPVELAVPGGAFVREARRRGFHITESIAESASPEMLVGAAE